jgi:hypothetical protein
LHFSQSGGITADLPTAQAPTLYGRSCGQRTAALPTVEGVQLGNELAAVNLLQQQLADHHFVTRFLRLPALLAQQHRTPL